MLNNNNERLNIVMKMVNPYSYQEFERICMEKGIVPMCKFEYAQKVGLLSCALVDYPDLLPAAAYKKFIANNPFAPIIQSSTASVDFITTRIATNNSGCGSCGGGKVR